MFRIKGDGLILIGLACYCFAAADKITEFEGLGYFVPIFAMTGVVALTFGIDALTGLRLVRYLASLKRG